MTKFNKINENEVEVELNGETFGTLKFDAEQDAWVLWPVSIDDAVSYFDNLDETKEAIADELA
ncbi:hypothetical protein MUDAN_DOGOELCO_03272 [Lactiplantibacillus mudanjiangensis]|uniref:hypothetical protein n=1 Tax=Lactiplantibacillus mudanjiangensis TaxID=1296538 RepID=UPI001013DE45|nr:hypothetical protein [Lactiplantibacillus mudanjiangensis]VDG31428.1 hypothetical protein MUDAN_DOGOELCO_03272 [Lactiplantibacillus mudanjiangensis]